MSLAVLVLSWLAATPALLAAPAAPAADAVELAVDAAEAAVTAVVAAVQARMGENAEVTVNAVRDVTLSGGPVVDAVPVPGAMLGPATRFVLRGAAPTAGDPGRLVAVGYATVTLTVRVTHAHASRAVRRGTALDSADLMAVTHEFAAGALMRPLDVATAEHGRALRDLPAGACLAARAVMPAPAVRAGSEVMAIIRGGGIEVRAAVVSIDSGAPGDTVRVTNPQSRKTFRARVVARDEVEISHE